jgi:hypothetical protein
MGGIVAKEASYTDSSILQGTASRTVGLPYMALQIQAYIMARQDPSCHHLASRIVAMVFLATPHRGSDYATYLNKLLRVSVKHGARPYVSDLERVSSSLVRVNDTFRHYCDELTLYSFFETRELNIGATASALIVPKDSAILGLPGERVSMMYADHRSICKFESPEDPGYITLTEAFNTIKKETAKRGKFYGRLIFHGRIRSLRYGC